MESSQQPASAGSAPSQPPTFEFRAPDDTRVTPDAWQSLVAKIQAELVADGIDPTDAARVLPDFVLADEAARRWHYDGTGWYGLAGRTWEPGTPPPSLRIVSLTLEAAPELPGTPGEPTTAGQPAQPATPAQPAISAQPAVSAQQAPIAAAAPHVPVGPTHRVPPSGMPAWSTPNGNVAPSAMLPPGLDLAILESQPTGWARVVAANGWSGWVDGRQLHPR